MFDEQGHIVITPKEVHRLALDDPQRLIHEMLIPGTPLAFDTHESYCHFLQHFGDTLNVHPRNILLKGSTKIGFSIAPRPNKVWRRFGDGSDLDLAIVDQHYFDRIDEEVRAWERTPANRQRLFCDERVRKEGINRRRTRGSYHCLRYFDLPPVETVAHHNSCLERAPVELCCGLPRTLTAFIFRDWWGIADRYLSDIEELARKLGNPALKMPVGEDAPLPRADAA